MSDLDKDHYAPDSLRRFFGMLLHEYPSGKIREMAFEALHGPPPDLSGQDEQVVARLAWDAERWESEFVVPKARAEAAEAQLREMREGYYGALREKRALEQALEKLREFLKAFDEAQDARQAPCRWCAGPMVAIEDGNWMCPSCWRTAGSSGEPSK